MNISDYFIDELPPCEQDEYHWHEDRQNWQDQQQEQLRND